MIFWNKNTIKNNKLCYNAILKIYHISSKLHKFEYLDTTFEWYVKITSLNVKK